MKFYIKKSNDVSNLGLVFVGKGFSAFADTHSDLSTHVTLAMYTDVATASLCVHGLVSELHMCNLVITVCLANLVPIKTVVISNK